MIPCPHDTGARDARFRPPHLFERKRTVIRAITFDLRDTVIHDDSDEPKRAAAGPPPKSGNAP